MLRTVLESESAFPTELFIHIISFVEQKRDLVTLCRVSKTFRDICMPLLYRHLHIKTGKRHLETHSGIYKALQSPSITHVVVVLSVELDKNLLCRTKKPDIDGLPSLHPCTCTRYDSSLGDIILSLQNLRNLTIRCTLCSQSHGHEYLFKLNSPALRKFAFHCYGSAGFGKDTDGRSVLLAPFMSQLIALSLACEQAGRDSRWNEALQLLQEANGLAHLDTLVHNGSPLFDFLLSHCRVRRLSLSGGGTEEAMATIRRSPGGLTHLFSPSMIYWLPPAIKHGIGPYIHLKFIGTLEGAYTDVGSSQI